MQLMTKEIENALQKYPLYSQDGKGGKAKVVVKYFGGPAATWLITEGEPLPGGDWEFFGFCTLGLPDPAARGKLLWEWGYVTLSQLQRARFPPFGLGVERDITVKPGKETVQELACMCAMFEKEVSGGMNTVSRNAKPSRSDSLRTLAHRIALFGDLADPYGFRDSSDSGTYEEMIEVAEDGIYGDLVNGRYDALIEWLDGFTDPEESVAEVVYEAGKLLGEVSALKRASGTAKSRSVKKKTGRTSKPKTIRQKRAVQVRKSNASKNGRSR